MQACVHVSMFMRHISTPSEARFLLVAHGEDRDGLPVDPVSRYIPAVANSKQPLPILF